jgi:elongation factor P--(R)-beta-lysine ligase
MMDDPSQKNKIQWKTRLKQRQQIIAAIREDLQQQNFLEAETPIIVKGTTPDVYLDTIQVGEHYLITSTEYQIKRLIAEGFDRVFTLTKNFRAHDCGRYHQSEFTMLEWGRAFSTLEEIEEDAKRFIWSAFSRLFPDQRTVLFNGQEIDLSPSAWKSLTVRQAFKEYLGLENLEDFSLNPLLAASKKANILIPIDFQSDQSLVISYLLDQLQGYLGKESPVFLHEWPSYLTSSAPTSSKDLHVAERSELYIGGIEIANGFPFLRDPNQQRSLFEEQLQKRKEIGKSGVVLDEKYIDSLNTLPDGAGMALGVDRLVMILTGATRISDVQAFTWDEL